MKDRTPINKPRKSGSAPGKTGRERGGETGTGGRSAERARRADSEETNEELIDEAARDAKETLLEAAPESERWDPLPGSPGHKALTPPSEDEDDEGRSANERLVEEGVAQAEEEQTLEAERDAAKEDKEDE